MEIKVTYALLEKIAKGKVTHPEIVAAWWEHQYPVFGMRLPIYFSLVDGTRYRLAWDYEKHTLIKQTAKEVTKIEWI